MEIELSNGQLKFWQWDTKQKVKVPEGVPTVHFKFGSSAVKFPVTDQWVDVPDELLQTGKDIYLWTYDEDHTLDAARIPVEKRPKPADYVYTPTEIKTWESLDARIEALEKGGGVAGVTSVNGKTGAVTLNADDVGAVSTVNGARGAVKTAFYATAAQKGREVSVSPSPKKIYEAYAAGHSVYVKADYTIMDGLTLTLPLVLAVNYSNTYVLAFSTVGALRDNSAPMTPVVSFDGNAWRMWITEGVKSDDKLPNPEELVVPLNGTKYTYDGRYMLQLPEINTKSLNVTGAAVGQTVKISAVDDNGVPTAWVPVDMASGGGEREWVKLYDGTTTITDEVSAIEVDILRSDTAKKFQIWLSFSANEATDWGSNKYITASINGASVCYTNFVTTRLNSAYEVFFQVNCEGYISTYAVSGNVRIQYNRYPLYFQSWGDHQRNNGKLRIQFGAPYKGTMNALVWGEY